MFRYFGGLDFSGAREPLDNLWAAFGEERDGKLHVLSLRPLPFRADASEYLVSGWRTECGADAGARVLWGCDFPFALPQAATVIAGARTWDESVRWLAERDLAAVTETLEATRKLRRKCDEAAGALPPLDLRTAAQTVCGARFLFELTRDHGVAVAPQARRDDAATTLIEVYPSGTAKDIGIKGGRKPKRAGEVAARCAGLRQYASFDHPSIEAAAAALEDARDAVLACVTAYLVRADLQQHQRGGIEDATTALEGWIYRHPAAVV